MHFNWIDGIIGVVIFYNLLTGWEAGFISLTENLVAFLGSLWFSIKYHGVVGSFLVAKFGVPTVWSSVLGYVIVGILTDILIRGLLRIFTDGLPKEVRQSHANRWLGSVVATLNGLVVIAFGLLLITVLPVRGTIKKDINNSWVATQLLFLTDRYGGQMKSTVDEAATQALKFVTVEPTSKERITLDVSPSQNQLSIDAESESRMLVLVNQERAKVGAPALTIDPKITVVARGHSRDMFERKYFSHVSPEGKDAGDRLTTAGVSYMVAGENLAYAPDVGTAHQGLMNSEGHKRNILDPQFHRIGIGVINGGIYGEMFTQNFAD